MASIKSYRNPLKRAEFYVKEQDIDQQSPQILDTPTLVNTINYLYIYAIEVEIICIIHTK